MTFDPTKPVQTRDVRRGGCDCGLVNVPEKRVGYLNIYGDSYPPAAVTVMHDSKLAADCAGYRGRTACIRVEYEEGQYDD